MNRSISFSISFVGHVGCVGLLLFTGKPGRDKPIVMEACRVTLFAPQAFAAPSPRDDGLTKAAPRRTVSKPAPKPKPTPRPVFVTRKVTRPQPPPPEDRSEELPQLTKLELEEEALAPLPRGAVSERGALSRLSVSAGGSSTFDAYIAGIIKSNWVRPSRSLVGENPASVSVAIRIGVNGSITQVRVSRGSGIGSLDTSAVKAIERSNPLPIGLPSYMTCQYYDVTIVFRITDEV